MAAETGLMIAVPRHRQTQALYVKSVETIRSHSASSESLATG